MSANNRSVAIVWSGADAEEPNRLAVSRRFLLFLGGLFFFSVLSAVVSGAVVAQVHRENAALRARLAALREERGDLARGLAAAQAEIAKAKEGLARVRAEEAKIRAWLGLDHNSGEAQKAAPGGSGGKGSLGDVELDAVSLEDRGAEAESVELTGEAIGTVAEALAEDLSELASRVQERKKHWDAIPAVSPVDGEHWISSAFGWRESPFTGKREFHSGIDMAGQRDTPVVAAADGRVTRVVRDAALGRVVTLDHGNGIQTIYGHLDETLVKKGDRVTRGEEIGKMGSTGRRSTGPHLHYAVKQDGKYVNPKNYLLDWSQLPYPLAKIVN